MQDLIADIIINHLIACDTLGSLNYKSHEEQIMPFVKRKTQSIKSALIILNLSK